jgi:uncharacterized protein (TIGR02646 family)
MIRVDKPASAIPAEFLEASRRETQAVLAHFGARRRGAKAFKFAAYRHKKLKEALEKLFHGKCAYCEWRYGGGSYFEVEHYRPKSHYYWLAAEWSNLLPSCKKCNNGKLSKFPLADEKKRARRKGEERRERPLLLNPSDGRTDPARHLAFSPGDGAIRPAPLAGSRPSPFGETSIQVYRLARAELARERIEWDLRVQDKIRICRLTARTGDRKEKERAYQELKQVLEPHQPFRALTLTILRQHGFGS